jgi:dynein light chain 4
MSDDAINFEALKDTPIGKRGYILAPALANDMKKSFSKPIIKSTDMSSDLLSEALDMVVSAVDQKPSYEAAAKAIKEGMDKKFGPTWHCIIGGAYGFDITMQSESLLYCFYQGKVGVLLFKC